MAQADLIASLFAALAAQRPDLAGAALAPLADTGLAHWHVRIGDSGWLARIPKQSQMRLGAAENLAYQAACFQRAGESRATPGLGGVLTPDAHLPRGALLVEEIRGPTAQLPRDLPAVAQALARIHRLAPPPRAERPPLLDADDPLADMAREIGEQAAHLDAAGLAPEARDIVDRALARLRALVARPERPESRLISFDAHPGNFLVRADGSAALVDLEKARYSYPPFDLAHATLYTSTTWDVASHSVLPPDEVAAFHDAWIAEFGAGADNWRPWLASLRRVMWLWSVTWCAKWRVLSARDASQSVDGEDWSAESNDAALITHVRGRVDEYLSAECLARVGGEIDVLDAAG